MIYFVTIYLINVRITEKGKRIECNTIVNIENRSKNERLNKEKTLFFQF